MEGEHGRCREVEAMYASGRPVMDPPEQSETEVLNDGSQDGEEDVEDADAIEAWLAEIRFACLLSAPESSPIRRRWPPGLRRGSRRGWQRQHCHEELAQVCIAVISTKIPLEDGHLGVAAGSDSPLHCVLVEESRGGSFARCGRRLQGAALR